MSSQLNQQENSVTTTLNPEGELANFISDGRLTGQASAWMMRHSKHIIEWLKRSDVRKILLTLLASGGTFAAVLTTIMSLGFGSVGIGGGTIAAGIQSALYGGFTPAGGLFAGLQSAGMTGALLPMAAGVAGGAALIVLGVGFFKWFRGREGHDEDGHQHED